MKPMATLEMNVGPEGGRYHSGSLSVLIPDGAVSERVNIKCIYMSMKG